MKKGQLFAQPFIIIFALIVAAMILGAGIKIVWDVMERGQCTKLYSEVTDLRADIKEYYNLEPDSAKKVEFTVPKDVNCFCFKYDSPSLDFTKLAGCDDEGVVKVSMENSPAQKYHLFVAFEDSEKACSAWEFNLNPNGEYTIVQFPSNPYCIKIKDNIFSAQLTNMGTYVLIEES